MNKTDYRSLYDKDFIGAWDLEGGDLTVTIKKCTGGSLTAPGGKKSKKPIVYMTHTDKGFALNATNGKTIAALYGKYVEAWAGKRITLYKSMTRFGADDQVECIRVRPTIPGDELETAAPQPAQESTPPPVESAAGTAATSTEIGADQAIHLEDLCKETKTTPKGLLQVIGAKVTTLSKLPPNLYQPALDFLAKRRETA